jgi:hypothetical protein
MENDIDHLLADGQPISDFLLLARRALVMGLFRSAEMLCAG